jgi:hypothetical protein
MGDSQQNERSSAGCRLQARQATKFRNLSLCPLLAAKRLRVKISPNFFDNDLYSDRTISYTHPPSSPHTICQPPTVDATKTCYLPPTWDIPAAGPLALGSVLSLVKRPLPSLVISAVCASTTPTRGTVGDAPAPTQLHIYSSRKRQFLVQHTPRAALARSSCPSPFGRRFWAWRQRQALVFNVTTH